MGGWDYSDWNSRGQCASMYAHSDYLNECYSDSSCESETVYSKCNIDSDTVAGVAADAELLINCIIQGEAVSEDSYCPDGGEGEWSFQFWESTGQCIKNLEA